MMSSSEINEIERLKMSYDRICIQIMQKDYVKEDVNTLYVIDDDAVLKHRPDIKD